MKSLNTIQTLSKIAKIISTILFVCAIVGLCLCAAAVVSFALGFEAFKLGGVTIESVMPFAASLPKGALYATEAQGMMYCIAAIILARLAMTYFKRELADGTPFTLGGAKALLRLGILGVCIPLAADALCAILRAVFETTMTNSLFQDVNGFSAAAIGVALIVISLLCKYGAELQSEQDAAPAAETEQT